MLKGAHHYKDQIIEKTLASYDDKYYNMLYLEKDKDFPIYCSCVKLKDAIMLGLKYYDVVSVDSSDRVVGRFTIRLGETIDNIEMVHYKDSGDILPFCRDLKSIIEQLEDAEEVNEVSWYVVDGNPIEKVHERYLKKWGGTVESKVVTDNLGDKIVLKKYTLKRRG